jgi:hypothetical protein
MSLLRVRESFGRMLKRLPRQLVSRLMILFSVMRRRYPVRVGGTFVEFSRPLVRIT